MECSECPLTLACWSGYLPAWGCVRGHPFPAGKAKNVCDTVMVEKAEMNVSRYYIIKACPRAQEFPRANFCCPMCNKNIWQGYETIRGPVEDMTIWEHYKRP